jgi:hypothetical protein
MPVLSLTRLTNIFRVQKFEGDIRIRDFIHQKETRLSFYQFYLHPNARK